MSLPHPTKRIQVWADVDIGIADLVEYLNTIPGVTTHASCQGTIGEGGPHPYRPQVMCTWTPEALERLRDEFDITMEGNATWGYVHPKELIVEVKYGPSIITNKNWIKEIIA
jgi:hypothetical protein